MHLIIIQLQRQSPPVFCRFPNVKTLAQSMFPTRRSHNDTRTNAYNVSSFNRLLRSLFTQSCFRKATFTYSCACQADSEVAVNANLELRSQNCKSYWNLEVSARVPRFGHLLWCLYLQIEAIVFCDKQFSERPSLWLVKTLWSTVLWSAQRKKTKLKLFWQPKWHLTGVVEDLNNEHWYRPIMPKHIPRHCEAKWRPANQRWIEHVSSMGMTWT